MFQDKIKLTLEEHPVIQFVALVFVAVASHLLAALTFDLVFAETAPSMPVLWACLTITIVAVFLLKQPTHLWVWSALAAFLAFQFLCLALHHQLMHATPALAVAGLVSLACLSGAYYLVYANAKPETHVPIQTAISSPVPDRSLAEAPTRAVVAVAEIMEVPVVAKTDSLILFLSLARDSGLAIVQQLQSANLGDLASFGEPNRDFNWYMPVVAIHTHVTFLPQQEPLRVVVIPSADSPRGGGSWRQAATFIEFIHRAAGNGSWNVKVEVLPGYEEGVRYEDLVAVGKSIDAAREYLAPSAKRPILIDITSGQATCTAVAAGLAVLTRDRFQYVSTEDYIVRLYDFRVSQRESPI